MTFHLPPGGRRAHAAAAACVLMLAHGPLPARRSRWI